MVKNFVRCYMRWIFLFFINISESIFSFIHSLNGSTVSGENEYTHVYFILRWNRRNDICFIAEEENVFFRYKYTF